jgi:hypothetical protein
MAAMTLEDELVGEPKEQRKNHSSLLRNTSGRMLSEEGVAHQVISDDAQWKKFQEQMRQKGAVSGMTLKQNLNGLLQDRANELQTPKPAPGNASRRRTSYIAEFATSLILGDGDQAGQRISAQTPLQQAKKSNLSNHGGHRFSNFFTDGTARKDPQVEDQGSRESSASNRKQKYCESDSESNDEDNEYYHE